MKNDIYVIFNEDLNTWIKKYEDLEYQYHFTREEVDQIIEEYIKDKDKDVEALIIWKLNKLIPQIYVESGLKEEAGL